MFEGWWIIIKYFDAEVTSTRLYICRFIPHAHNNKGIYQNIMVREENSMSIIMSATFACVLATNTSTCAELGRLGPTWDVTRIASAPPPSASETAAQGTATSPAVLFSLVMPVIGRVYLPIANATTAISSALRASPLQYGFYRIATMPLLLILSALSVTFGLFDFMLIDESRYAAGILIN